MFEVILLTDRKAAAFSLVAEITVRRRRRFYE